MNKQARVLEPSEQNLTLVAQSSLPQILKSEPWQQPVLWSAAIAFLGTLILIWMNHRLHKSRLGFDERLAMLKHEHDIRIAERKFQLDRDLNDWRRRSEFAEAALADFYEARSRLTAIRSPGSYSTENEDRIGRESEPDNLRNARDSYYPYSRRVRDHASEFFNAFYSKRYRARALFGPDLEAAYVVTWQELMKVGVAANALVRYALDENDNMADFLEKMRRRIWDGLEDPDETAAALDAAVLEAERILRPAISSLPGPD